MTGRLQPEGSHPLVVVFGATASGKTALSVALAERFGAEILSCDSVAVYRGMELGTAKPSDEERRRVPHHLLDLYDPNQACTAGDWARAATAALADVAGRGRLAIVSGGTGLYLRALLDGLFAAPQRDDRLRELLRRRAEKRGPASLHTLLARLDPQAAGKIHANDLSKVVRAIEVTLAARQPITEQWATGRAGLEGYRVLRLGLDPPRAELYARIDRRARAMFDAGLVEETRGLIKQYGAETRALGSLGYAQAAAVLRGELAMAEAIAAAQQGHRNYAKRQRTWFRGEAERHSVSWLHGVGDDPAVLRQAEDRVDGFLSQEFAATAAAQRGRQPV